jgi:3-deoxy-D-manno-octulosonic-acid transferase
MALVYLVARLASVFGPSSLRERLGFFSEDDQKKLSTGWNVWLHAASAGEVNAITPFCQAFRKAKPEAKIVLTTTSQMGKKIAMEKGMADAVFLAPLDMAPPLRRVFETFRPVMVLIAETEFWPGMLLRAGKNGIPVLLVNGRISDRSFPSYRRLKSLFRPALNCFNACLVQTQKDAEKIIALGVSEIRVRVAGQMKYDRSAPDAIAVQNFKEKLSLFQKDILFTFGSLRGGEDDLLLPLVPEILRFSPDVKVLIAPRHLKNASLFQEKLKNAQVASVLRTQLEKNHVPERVIVLDTVGELSLAYAFSRAVFVGGTLVPVGGHNVMEPALSSVPVCFGPQTQNVSEAAEALLKAGGGVLVKDGAELLAAFKGFLDADLAKEVGRKAHESVLSMRGATERTVERVLAAWPLHT